MSVTYDCVTTIEDFTEATLLLVAAAILRQTCDPTDLGCGNGSSRILISGVGDEAPKASEGIDVAQAFDEFTARGMPKLFRRRRI